MFFLVKKRWWRKCSVLCSMSFALLLFVTKCRVTFSPSPVAPTTQWDTLCLLLHHSNKVATFFSCQHRHTRARTHIYTLARKLCIILNKLIKLSTRSKCCHKSVSHTHPHTQWRVIAYLHETLGKFEFRAPRSLQCKCRHCRHFSLWRGGILWRWEVYL